MTDNEKSEVESISSAASELQTEVNLLQAEHAAALAALKALVGQCLTVPGSDAGELEAAIKRAVEVLEKAGRH